MKLSYMGSLVALTTTVACAGCGGAGSGTTVPQGVTLAQGGMHKGSSAGALIYAFGSFNGNGGPGIIIDYPSGQVVNSVTVPFGVPDSTCSDSSGNVFVGGQSPSSAAPVMAKLAYGATSPSASVSIGSSPGRVMSCSVDKTTGSVAALIQYDNFSFAVAVLPDFTGTPALYTDSGIWRFLSVGYDGSGNLFLLGTQQGSSSSAYDLAELPSGGGSFESISLTLGSHVTELRTLQWDGKYVTLFGRYESKGVPETWAPAIYQLKISGSSASIANTVLLRAIIKNPDESSWIAPSLNAIVLGRGKLHIFKYPAGGKQVERLTEDGKVYTATVAVPSSQ